MMKNNLLLLTLTYLVFLASCGGSSGSAPKPDPNDPMSNKGVGPIRKVELGTIDMDMAEAGKAIFLQMCSACHKQDERFIGPAPRGIMSRRSPEWIMNMILNPEKMVAEDPVARQLLVEHNLAPMANQQLTEEQARKILEYFRTLN
jgi:cytochrome c